MWKYHPGSSCCVPGPHLNFCPHQGQPLSRGLRQAAALASQLSKPFLQSGSLLRGKVTLAGWLATNLLILPGCKVCDLMTELKKGKTLQGRWTVPLCFPNVIPLPCMEFFIPEGNQMFQGQAIVYCLVLKPWVRLGGYMCDFRHRSMAYPVHNNSAQYKHSLGSDCLNTHFKGLGFVCLHLKLWMCVPLFL